MHENACEHMINRSNQMANAKIFDFSLFSTESQVKATEFFVQALRAKSVELYSAVGGWSRVSCVTFAKQNYLIN